MRVARLVLMLLLSAGLLAVPAPSQAQVAIGVSVRIGPPALPVYAQPICPGPGYIWIPGYWAYGDDDYFWVPGTWVIAPEPGFLWTPGYWGWSNGFYIWHVGYWGPVVGFYGGINYGFGYPGTGFYGGYWRSGNYYYNRSVTNVNVTVVHNVYENTVINEHNVTRISYNGGPGGINARATHEEQRAEHDRHIPMTAEQNHHFEAARSDRSLFASVNHGRPEVAASPRPAEFHGHAAADNGRFGNQNRPDNRQENRVEPNRPGRQAESNGRNFPDRPGRPADNVGRGSSDRPGRVENGGRASSDRPPFTRSSNGPSSNPALEQKHQREFDKMQRQHDAERQKMQQRHDQEQQRQSRQNANQQRQDQVQRRQQQQMEQMNRMHEQQSQRLQEHQQRENQKQESRKPNNNRPQR